MGSHAPLTFLCRFCLFHCWCCFLFELSPSAQQMAYVNYKKYDVFLSFRGADVRRTFVDHLLIRLEGAGVRVFNDERLQKGEDIRCSLWQAIQHSAIHIPIFSPRYAESHWCLDEVTEIAKWQGLIIPLFYGVEPTHVRNPLEEQSPYAAALKEHSIKGKYSPDRIAAWEKALRQISRLSGWTFNTTYGYEGQFVERVVSDVGNRLISDVRLVVDKPVVGPDELMSRALYVGILIWGIVWMGHMLLVP